MSCGSDIFDQSALLFKGGAAAGDDGISKLGSDMST